LTVLANGTEVISLKLPFVFTAAGDKLDAQSGMRARCRKMEFPNPHSKEGYVMRFAACLLGLFVCLASAAGFAAGTARSENFTVIAPTAELAEAVSAQAEVFRKQAALDWLGKELPDGVSRTVISVSVSADRDDGLTWPRDRPEQKFHQVWLTTSKQHAIGTTLQHEVLHTVLATFAAPDFLVPWANEGIASQVDDAARKQSRAQIAARWASTGRWPQLQALLTTARITHDDAETYAAAASFTQFLASHGGKSLVLDFAKSGRHGDWDQAARDCYRARDVADLQARWQTWIRETTTQSAARTAAAARPVAAAVN
jgi:hypothetical protein